MEDFEVENFFKRSVACCLCSSTCMWYMYVHIIIVQGLIQGGARGGKCPPKDSSRPPKHVTPLPNICLGVTRATGTARG